MFSACLPRREPLTADNFPSSPSAPESSRAAGAFDAPHACDASSSSLDDDGPHDRVCVIVNVRAPGAKTAVKRLKRLHGVEVLVMDSKSQERLLRRLEELLVGSDGNDARDKDDGHGRGGRIRFLAGGGDGTIAAAASLIALACERAGLAPELRAPVAPLPLGTGNELSRICGWGALYAGAPLERIVRDVSRAYLAKLDMWTATIAPNETEPFGGGFDDVYTTGEETSHSRRRTRERKFCCFFSVGFDAPSRTDSRVDGNGTRSRAPPRGRTRRGTPTTAPRSLSPGADASSARTANRRWSYGWMVGESTWGGT